VWTLAEILDEGATWSEAEYKKHRPKSFSGVDHRGTWARLDAAIRRRRLGHELTEKWEVSYVRVCNNLRHAQQQSTEDSSGDEKSEHGGERVDVNTTETMSAVMEAEISRMQRQHKRQMRQFRREWEAVMSRMRNQLEIQQ
jgi:hypothetical protein